MIKKRFSIFYRSVFILILAALISGCGSGTPTSAPTQPPPDAKLVRDPNISDIFAGQTVALSVEASGQKLQFKWSVVRGTLSASDTPNVIYTAPDTSGVDTVAVEVNSASGTTTRSVSFNIIVPATDTPTPTPVVPDTPIPPPLLELFPQAVDGVEFPFMSKDISKEASLTFNFVTDQDCVHSGIYGLRFAYNMPEQKDSGGWGVHWNNPPVTRFNASNFKTLNFWVKGASEDQKFQISMKDTNGKEFWIESRALLVVTTTWGMVSIPLDKFQGVNISSIENFAFGFNNAHGPGAICIDDIAFAP